MTSAYGVFFRCVNCESTLQLVKRQSVNFRQLITKAIIAIDTIDHEKCIWKMEDFEDARLARNLKDRTRKYPERLKQNLKEGMPVGLKTIRSIITSQREQGRSGNNPRLITRSFIHNWLSGINLGCCSIACDAFNNFATARSVDLLPAARYFTLLQGMSGRSGMSYDCDLD